MNKRISSATIALCVGILAASVYPAYAQTIGYSEALGALGRNCGKELDKFCSKVNLGGGRMADCLEQHSADVSPSVFVGRFFGPLRATVPLAAGMLGLSYW
jgi:hypothetical protein